MTNNQGVLLGRDLEIRTKTHVEQGEAGLVDPKTGNMSVTAGKMGPVALTRDWTLQDNGGWVAMCRRLWFEPGSGEYHEKDWNREQYPLYYPLSTGEKPPGGAGSRAFAVYRGRWEVIAFGGMEQLGYQSCAVVSYTMASLGPYVDCEKNDYSDGRCEVFPDTPAAFGECGCVRVRRLRGSEVDLLVCLGGRYKTTVDAEITVPDGSNKIVQKTVFEYHEVPWHLDLQNPAEGWRQGLLPAIPTPRHNAGVSEVVTTTEPLLNENGEPTGAMREVDRVFVIGGRNADGLLASIEALNLTDGIFETHWPGLDGR